MRRYVISYTSRTASEQGGGGGTLFYAEDDEIALAIQEAISAVQTPQTWRSVTAAVTVVEGRQGASLEGTKELRVNPKYANGVVGFYHFPLVAAPITHALLEGLLMGEGKDDPAAPVSEVGSPITAIVKYGIVNMR